MGNLDERTKMLLFTRWLAASYSDTLNSHGDEWYIYKLNYFFEHTLEDYIERGLYLDKRELIQKYEQPGRED